MWNNKTEGTRFELEFTAALAAHNFWVHRFQDNKNGQPCDVMAAKNRNTYLFDCKDCKGDRLRLSRLEENQLNAMQLFEATGNSKGMFAVRFSDGEIYLLDYRELKILRERGVRSLSKEDCRIRGQSFRTWLQNRDDVEWE